MPKSVLYNHERDKDRIRERERERERLFPGGKEELIKKREVQDHAFTLKSLFTSKLTLLTLRPLTYSCLLITEFYLQLGSGRGFFLFFSSPSL